ncbi:unnamed protein product [Caenorhabditis bovis]|uniref:Serine/threonine-protein phosphatase n=1 Tax=Caenorhabditis bovis TaxID=2654633 RepID=A0A8S1EVX3_9PELO|nr:unnamed protein product [Caenorhabditis bovis]
MEKKPLEHNNNSKPKYQNISKEDIVHDEEVAAIIHRIVSAPVVTNKMQKVYELKADISVNEMISLCDKMKKCFLESDVLLNIDSSSPICVVADLHGQAVHLLRILRTCGSPPAQRYIFLGDYVDRGSQGILILCLLFCMKYRYPKHVYLLRGNHEDVNTTLNYGFYEECIQRFATTSDDLVTGEKVWRACIETFNTMPLAALLDKKIFCCHGGISPFMSSLQDIQKIERPLIIPPFGLACDLLWSDPSNNGNEGWALSHRGISFTYGFDTAEEFCKKNNVHLIIRGHQLFRELYATGYVFRFGGILISLFSALNYENHRNNAAVIKINFKSSIEVTPIVFRCRHYVPQKPSETIGYKDWEYRQNAIKNKKDSVSISGNKSEKVRTRHDG